MKDTLSAYQELIKENIDYYMVFIEECKKRSYYNTDYTAQYGDKLITLSTCEYSYKNGRMVVAGCKLNTNKLK